MSKCQRTHGILETRQNVSGKSILKNVSGKAKKNKQQIKNLNRKVAKGKAQVGKKKETKNKQTVKQSEKKTETKWKKKWKKTGKKSEQYSYKKEAKKCSCGFMCSSKEKACQNTTTRCVRRLRCMVQSVSRL